VPADTKFPSDKRLEIPNTRTQIRFMYTQNKALPHEPIQQVQIGKIFCNQIPFFQHVKS
jgi:hypothetical protein